MTSHIGLQKSELDTPALLLDLDDFEKNLVRLQSYLNEHSVNLRPHFKAHRTPDITRWQFERGAKGVTCAKLGEAEHLASLGFDNFLVANQVAGDIKLKRLAELSKTTEVMIQKKGLWTYQGMDMQKYLRKYDKNGGGRLMNT